MPELTYNIVEIKELNFAELETNYRRVCYGRNEPEAIIFNHNDYLRFLAILPPSIREHFEKSNKFHNAIVHCSYTSELNHIWILNPKNEKDLKNDGTEKVYNCLIIIKEGEK